MVGLFCRTPTGAWSPQNVQASQGLSFAGACVPINSEVESSAAFVCLLYSAVGEAWSVLEASWRLQPLSGRSGSIAMNYNSTQIFSKIKQKLWFTWIRACVLGWGYLQQIPHSPCYQGWKSNLCRLHLLRSVFPLPLLDSSSIAAAWFFLQGSPCKLISFPDVFVVLIEVVLFLLMAPFSSCREFCTNCQYF